MARWNETADRRDAREDAGRQRARRRVLEPAFKDLDVVRLVQDFDCPGGRISKGTQGTILQVFDNRRAYQVEFEGAFDVPGTGPAGMLAPDVQPSQR